MVDLSVMPAPTEGRPGFFERHYRTPSNASEEREPVIQPAGARRVFQVSGDYTDIVGEEKEEEGRFTAGSHRIHGDELIARATDAFIGAIKRHLREDGEDLIEENEAPPTTAAFGACVELAKKLAPIVAMKPRLRRAAFTESDGGVSLVLQSLVSDRRISYRISPDGRCVKGLEIDEHMTTRSFTTLLTDPAGLKERAEWVVRRV